ncbi:MAG: thioesterase [Anaerolineae bacterium]|nr:thioesterase [Anaerolineae bacterium]
MAKNTPLDTWIYKPKPNPQARLRLLCLPYAGGGATIYRTWPAHLPPEIEVWAIRLPGREVRLSEIPYTQMLPLVQTLAQVLSQYVNSPFALFGHSMGAILSFELTHWFRKAQLPGPMHLFVSGHRAPQVPDRKPQLHHLPTADFVKELKDYNGTPKAVFQEPELMQLILPLLRADFTLVETYTYLPKPPLDCPISVFGGQDDTLVSLADLEAWRTQTSSHFNIRVYPGDHFFLRDAQPSLLRDITQDLALRRGI